MFLANFEDCADVAFRDGGWEVWAEVWAEAGRSALEVAGSEDGQSAWDGEVFIVDRPDMAELLNWMLDVCNGSKQQNKGWFGEGRVQIFNETRGRAPGNVTEDCDLCSLKASRPQGFRPIPYPFL